MQQHLALRKKLAFTLAVASGLLSLAIVASFSQAQPQKAPPPKAVSGAKAAPVKTVTPTAATISPLVFLDAQSEMPVGLIFQNRSKQPLNYLLGYTAESMADFNLLLFKDGKMVPSVAPTPNAPRLSKERVRTLAPGESLVQKWKLRTLYGNLQPGRYELKVSFKEESEHLLKEYGLSIVNTETTIPLQIE